MSDANALSPIKRALLEIRALNAKVEALEAGQHEPIAVIGMACRFPGEADSPEKLWDLLQTGRSGGIGPVPVDRWDQAAYYDPEPGKPGKLYTQGGGFLSDIDRFDAGLFGISPREAVSMDPQQRLLLETSWQALENAGIAPDSLVGSATGVFIGMSTNDYGRLAGDAPDVHFTTGNNYAVAAGRISYTLGLQGPALSLDTACSSSLVAAHVAMNSLRLGECDQALVGGVNLILWPETTVNFCQSGMLAADDRCKPFDAAANGYVRSEGVGMVVLKRLADAQADGDPIWGVLQGSAVNQDGRSSGLTAPNGPAQEAVIRAALANAGISPADVVYVEAHGTGTPLGDPIEIAALGRVLGEGRPADQPLWVGAVKSNLGHTEAAAGMAGLIKAVLALHHREIPPNLYFQTPNPHIDWDEIPVRVVQTRMPLPIYGERPYVGLSAFGFSGTNAHLILGPAPTPEPVQESGRQQSGGQIFALSARTDGSLRAQAWAYADLLHARPEALPEIAAAVKVSRARFKQRLAVNANDADSLQGALRDFAEQGRADGVVRGEGLPDAAERLAFLFSGQGGQYVQMARGLYDAEPVFREALDACNTLSTAYLPQALFEALYPTDAGSVLLTQMRYAQPAIFAVQYALAQLWRLWGVEPAYVLGHSVGEYAAACVAGVFSLEDAFKLVATRGRLMDELQTAGIMATVFAPAAQVEAILKPYAAGVSIAAVNSPESVVTSGEVGAVEALLADLKAQGIRSQKLAVTQASHSPLMEALLDDFEAVAQTVTYQRPGLAFVSGMTGALVQGDAISQAGYWRAHTRQTVQFMAGMETLYQQGARVFVEIGPNPTLLTLGQRCITAPDVHWIPSLRSGFEDTQQMQEGLSRLYVAGIDPNWAAYDGRFDRRICFDLPTYAFDRQSYWVAKAESLRDDVKARGLSWKALTEAVARQADLLPMGLNSEWYADLWTTLDQLARNAQYQALGALGAFRQAGERHTLDSLLVTCGIDAKYRVLVGRWLETLTADGLLQAVGDAYVTPRAWQNHDIGAVAYQSADVPEYVDVRPLLTYLGRCADLLPAVLTGAESPLETLFPGGDYATVDFMYHDWEVPRYFNGLMAQVALAAQAGRRLRVLEIGAGTGGTTAAILPLLTNAEYVFTDVSDFFLGHAQERFAAYPFVRYQVLDIERSPSEQGVALHSFDLIVASNVLHATENLDRTLGHVRQLLAADGVLALYEAAEHPQWFDISVGLIEGWSKFEDEWRGKHPLLTAEIWQRALLANGFVKTVAYPPEGHPTRHLLHNVVLAQGPHVVADSSYTLGEHNQESEAEVMPQADNSIQAQLAQALPADRLDILVGFVRDYVRRALRLPAEQPLSPRDRLMDIGFDSLMAVEMRARLSEGLGLAKVLPSTLIFDYPTIEAIAHYLLGLLPGEGETAAPTATPVSPDEAGPDDLAGLSDDEVAALLMKKLSDL
jgi:acyl transferase domain-containing protein/SAM-dependent methyltransferase